MPILKATVADVAALTALVNSAYRGETALRGWTTESHLLDGQRIDEESMQGYFQNASVTILKYINTNGRLIGCVYLEKIKNDRLYIGMLTVQPDLQAQGTGRQLLEAAEDIARQSGCIAVRMTVIPVRHELVAWYKRRGYEPNGEMMPFPADTRFGIPRQHLELMVLEKQIA